MAIGQTNAKINKGGGETPQLYDTRILNSASAPQGWAYVCSNSYRTFSSSTLPTLYNDINTKLQNSPVEDVANEVMTDIALPVSVDYGVEVIYCGNRYYIDTDGGNYYDTSDNTWKRINVNINFVALLTDDKGSIIIGVDEDTAVYKINPLNNNCVKIANSSHLTSGADHYAIKYIHNQKQYDDMLYIMQNNNYIFSTNTNLDNSLYTEYEFNKVIDDIEFVDGYWYIGSGVEVDESNKYIHTLYKGTSLSNGDLTDTTKWEVVHYFETTGATSSPPDSQARQYLQIFHYNNRFVVFTVSENSFIEDDNYYIAYYYTDDNFTTISQQFLLELYQSLYYVRFSNGYFIVPEWMYCDISKINDVNNWKDLKNEVLFQISEPINSIMYYMTKNSNDIVVIGNIYLSSHRQFTDNYFVATNSYNFNLTNLELQNIDESLLIDNTNILLKCNNNYYTSGFTGYSGSGLYIYDNNSWTKIQNSPDILCAVTDNKGSFIIGVNNDTEIYKFNPENNTFIKLANSSIFENPGSGFHTSISHKEFNNNFYFYANNNSFHQLSNHIYETLTDATSNTFIDHTFNKDVIDIIYYNNYWYLLVSKNDVGFEVYKGLSLSNNDFSDTTKWELIYTYTANVSANYLTVINGRFVIFYGKNYIYTDDEFNTVNTVNADFLPYYSEITTVNNIIVVCGENSLIYCRIEKIDNPNNWQTQIINNIIYSFTPPINNIIYLVVISGEDPNIEYNAYSLDLSSIDKNILINYSKYENFKICGYSDLTSLNDVYQQYGISQYWNIYNNTISIPVNKQQYSIMYVGDNFNDNLYNN